MLGATYLGSSYLGESFLIIVVTSVPFSYPHGGGGGKFTPRARSLRDQRFLNQQSYFNPPQPDLIPARPIIVNEPLMDALKDNYGKKKGEFVYLNMRRDDKPTFRKGLRTAKEHGHVIKGYVPKYVK